MAFDGLTLAALTDELSRTLTGGRISKIAMPEKDELLITVKNGKNYRLLISAGASLPLMYLTDENKLSPPAAPAFCMLLRKHIGSALIVSIRQNGLERIIEFELEHYNELGDLCRKKLIVELMGKYSNIIFCDDEGTIIDSIKRIPSTVSSIREVLPGRQYYIPESLRKVSPLDLTPESFEKFIELSKDASGKALCSTFEGISPVISEEVCFRAGIDSDKPYSYLSSTEKKVLADAFLGLMRDVREGLYSPCLITELASARPVEFSAVTLHSFKDAGYESQKYDSISRLLHDFYSARESHTRIRQKSADLRRITVTALERASKKYDLQQKQLNDCKGKEKYKVYGDLLNTYGYSLKGGEKSFTCENYYDGGREITIPLDEHKTASENAKKFFDRYAKLRRTEEALNSEITNTENDIEHLSSILTALDIAVSEAELSQIKDELSEYGYIKKHSGTRTGGSGASSVKKRPGLKAEPLHFISSDGYDIYVGKNNYQNEEVSFKIAGGNDLWFHVKNAPGSHVIVKTGAVDIKGLPDRLFSEAAGLAAWFSSKKDSDKVEVDYTYRKNLKRVPSGPPGFVIYHTNYSMLAEPISGLQLQ